MNFAASLVSKIDDTVNTSLVDFGKEDLMPGDLTITVEYSTVNYKDALAVTGRVMQAGDSGIK